MTRQILRYISVDFRGEVKSPEAGRIGASEGMNVWKRGQGMWVTHHL